MSVICKSYLHEDKFRITTDMSSDHSENISINEKKKHVIEREKLVGAALRCTAYTLIALH